LLHILIAWKYIIIVKIINDNNNDSLILISEKLTLRVKK